MPETYRERAEYLIKKSFIDAFERLLETNEFEDITTTQIIKESGIDESIEVFFPELFTDDKEDKDVRIETGGDITQSYDVYPGNYDEKVYEFFLRDFFEVSSAIGTQCEHSGKLDTECAHCTIASNERAPVRFEKDLAGAFDLLVKTKETQDQCNLYEAIDL